jgi:hypothetical protein
LRNWGYRISQLKGSGWEDPDPKRVSDMLPALSQRSYFWIIGTRIFGLLEHARETRFPVTKITLFVTPGWLEPCKTRPFCATGAPKISEFAPERAKQECSKIHPMAGEGSP